MLAARTGQAECRARVSARPLRGAVQCSQQHRTELLGRDVVPEEEGERAGGDGEGELGEDRPPAPHLALTQECRILLQYSVQYRVEGEHSRGEAGPAPGL